MTYNRMLVDAMLANEREHRQDFINTQDKVAHSKAIYKGEPVPYLHIPMMYTPKDVARFEEALSGIMAISKKTIDAYRSNPLVRSLFQFDKRLEELILLEHHYKAHVPMGRFDIFYYGDEGYYFCELNADGASAMNEEKELSQILTQTKVMEDFKKHHECTPFELFFTWVKAVSDMYLEYCTAKNLGAFDPSQTVVAIVDFIDKSSPIEFEVFKEAFIEEGFQCVIVDPRDLSCVNGRLVYNDLNIDIVYRRLVTKDLMDRYDEIPAFIEGLKADQTCVIGSVKTQVIHTKRFFEVLHHEAFQAFLTDSEKRFIQKHVPLTKPLKGDQLSTYIADKDTYIIKPMDYYASKGVCAGKDYTKEEWEALLKEKVNEDYIIQTYCPVAEVDNIVYNDKAAKLEHGVFGTITGLFVYNEALRGVYVRAGKNPIISGLHSGFTMSTVIVRDKQ